MRIRLRDVLASKPWPLGTNAVGAVMYKMLTGKVPIEASARSDAITDDEPDPHVKLQDMSGLNTYSDSLKKAIDWALEFKPKNRPQNARVLQDALLMTQIEDEIVLLEEVSLESYLYVDNDNINNITTIGNLMWQDEPYTIEEIQAKENDFLERWFRKKEYSKALKWHNSFEYSQNLRLGGYDDWRIPTIYELKILLSARAYLMHDIESEFWTSTDSEGLEGIAKRGVNFDKDINFEDAIDEDLVMLFYDSTNFIRCVRNI